MSETITAAQPTAASIASTKRLPSLPVVAMRMLEIAQQDEPDYRELCQVIRSDPAISGRVLKTVNSALFSFRPKIESIEKAVPKLGISMIRTLILGFHLSSWKGQDCNVQSLFQTLWRSCLTQAVIAELLAEKTKKDGPSCFTAGMIQDIGLLAMVSELREEYVEAVLSKCEFPCVVEAEQKHFGFTHTDVTVEILSRWNMGESFIEAIKLHHGDESHLAQGGDGIELSSILQGANLGAAVLAPGRSSQNGFNDSVTEWMRFLNSQFGFNPSDANELISEINDRVTDYSVIFNFDIDEATSIGHVVEQAKELLQEIAVESQLSLVASKNTVAQTSTNEELFRDYLSGLYNRRFLHESMNQHLDLWIKKRRPIAMLYLDVDKFKDINDTHGHRVGDQAIQHVANWLRTCTRETDFVVRLGGDEFLVVMQIKEKNYKQIAERLTREVPDLESSRGEQIPITLSVGGVFYQPKWGGNAFDANVLIDHADRQMYVAKKDGGNRIAYHCV